MTYTRQTVHNIKCDRCGRLCDQEAWYSDKSELDLWFETREWITLGRKHYCPDCYSRDEDDNIVVRAPKDNF